MCGADLEAERARRAARARGSARARLELPLSRRLGGYSAAGSVDWPQFLVAVLAALAIAPLGLILGIYWASRYHREGNALMAGLMLAAALLAAVAIFAPVWFWSHLLHV